MADCDMFGRARLPLNDACRLMNCMWGLQVTYPISEAGETTSLGQEARNFLDHRKTTAFKEAKSYGFWDWAAMLLPCITWLRKYKIGRAHV